jgi:hypothetical protein
VTKCRPAVESFSFDAVEGKCFSEQVDISGSFGLAINHLWEQNPSLT